MRFDTALREYVRTKILDIGSADLVVGIPTYNSESTVAHVLRTVADGLLKHFPGKKGVVLVSDGGSLDYTREVVQKIKLPGGVQRIIFIYRGLPGKGTALRAVFEAAVALRVGACAVFDSDLRSITPEWVERMVNPVLTGFDFVSPYYVRHKYDGTITNNIAYSLTRSLYGRRVRQPIGGDFGFSPKLAEYFTREYVWESDVARFGIDIWMTTSALCEGFQVCESWLGAKIHDPKDPAASLGPMFRQVVGTLFELMRKYESIWSRTNGSTSVPLLGVPLTAEAPVVEVDVGRLLRAFRQGLVHFGDVWKNVLEPENYGEWRALGEPAPVAAELWVRTVYDFASAHRDWDEDRGALVEMMTPLYFRRIASFIHETRDMTTEEAEAVIERQAVLFEENKPYLMRRCGIAAG